MKTYRVSASATIPAPAAAVYGIIADYREGHPRMIPRPPFGELIVEQGGTGTGTVIRYTVRVMGRDRPFRAFISEPEPGRVIQETDIDTSVVTSFTVDPTGDGAASVVTIASDLPDKGGLGGWITRAGTTRFLEQTYRRELELLSIAAAGAQA